MTTGRREPARLHSRSRSRADPSPRPLPLPRPHPQWTPGRPPLPPV